MDTSSHVVPDCSGVLIVLMLSSLGAATPYDGDFEFGWRFCRGDSPTAMMPGFDDSTWRMVDIPHDWSVEGPFRAEYASGTGYAPGGIGWYRKHFKLDTAWKGKLVAIEFDGVYNNSEVWINGHFIGRRPYGYSSFWYDLTAHVKHGSADNVVAVRVDHIKFADSRWYTGSGIYRHVRLHITDRLHIGHWGVFVTTPQVSKDAAVIRAETTIRNAYDQPRDFMLESAILSPKGKIIASVTASGTIKPQTEQILTPQLEIGHPLLWSTETPWLYTLRSRLSAGEAMADEASTPFGIRTTAFDPNKGFFLNGNPMKIKGVCLHHDAGCLGAAVPDKVLERRLRLLKDLGANAVRTSHNPPAPELLDLCDRLGLLVKDEAFDEFTPPKNKWVEGWNAGQPGKFGYGQVFTEWSVKDMEDMVRRDRNHPCVILWSIGNEIDYANDPFSHPVLGKGYRPEHPPAENLVKYAKPLIEAAKKWDGTRPVTAALASIDMSNAVGLAGLLDVVGYNYQEERYEADHKAYPSRCIFGSENGDSYGAWMAVRDNDYVAGQFLWTGIDYLGEARRWPTRASGAGLLDMCGFKKPVGWFRQSLWSDEPMVYLCVSDRPGQSARGMRGAEHWNWTQGRKVAILCCSNCSEVALTLNGQLLGVLLASQAKEGVLVWETAYEPGTLRAVGRQAGQDVCECALQTAGPVRRVVMSPDTTQLQADGKDICHIQFCLVDDQGLRVPDAEQEVAFDVEGPGRIIGIENGALDSLDDPKDHVHKAYHGRGLVVLQAQRRPGRIRITARSERLMPASIEIDVR